MKPTFFVFGYGYTAQVLARSISNHFNVVGTSRTGNSERVVWPGTDVSDLLSNATHLLISIPPDRDLDVVLRQERETIRRISSQIQWVGYLSTTGVYGDRNGGKVDEESALIPATRRGRLRVKAEAQWQEFAKEINLPLHIFRLAGIYGPERGPLTKVTAENARLIIKENQVFSRIHVNDIARVLTASMNKPNPGRIYNVCDDLAAPPQDVLTFAAQQLGIPTPPSVQFDDAKMSEMARSFYAESKRVSNHRIKSELGVQLQYPTFREGLRVANGADSGAID